MTQEAFEWIKVSGIFITAVGVVLALRQFLLANQQFKAVVAWNKLNATFTLFNSQSYIDRARPAAAALRDLGVELYRQNDSLTDDVVNKIVSDAKHYEPVKEFLNYLEDYAVAVNTGLLDDATAFAQMSDVVTRAHRIFWPLIKRRRLETQQLGQWMEIQKLCLEWDGRLASEEKGLMEADISAGMAEQEAKAVGDHIRNQAIAKAGAKGRYFK